MHNLCDKIYEAVNAGIQKALIITDNQSQDVSIKFHNKEISTEFIPYEYRTVDMGKAGIWCEYNLGAYPGSKPKNWYGDYYAWGETKTKDDYSWMTYEHCEGTKNTITKYNDNDGLNRLEPNDDVITQTLGNKFRMPTKEEYEKLIDNTTNEYVKNYKGIHGLNGRLFTAENDNTLFFPAAGNYYNSQCFLADEIGYIWSASPCTDDPSCVFYFFINSDEAFINNGNSFLGFPVRGIRNSSLN